MLHSYQLHGICVALWQQGEQHLILAPPSSFPDHCSQVDALEGEQQRLLAERADLEARMREQGGAWTQLHGLLRGTTGGNDVLAPSHVPGREVEVGVI